MRNNHKPSHVVSGATAVTYRVCLSKPSNDGYCEPTLGAGGRRFKSCLPDQANYAAYSAVRKGYFLEDPPASTAVVTGLLIPGGLLEIDVVAYNPDD